MKLNYCIVALLSIFLLTKCAIPKINQKKDKIKYSSTYFNNPDTANSGLSTWKLFFNDNKLKALIDTALNNNQELNIALMEIEISKAEIKARKGEYLPSVNLGANAGAEKVGRYTSQGANDANTDIKPGTKFPDPLSDFKLGLNASWEIDIWKKLRNAKKSAVLRYLATSEGKHFILTNLIAEIAKSYYELIALDNELVVLNNNIKIQTEALEIVKLEKNAAKVTELAVKKFQAEVLKNQSNLYYVKQKIIETENRINFLVGRFPQKVNRESSTYYSLNIDSVYIGVPSQLLFNRPDIKKAELELEASKLDVKSARANFYPSLSITSGLGLQAFNPSYLLKTPESLLYSITGDLMAPLINRNAIKANYLTANYKQLQAIHNYDQIILKSYIEVYNLVYKLNNLKGSYSLKEDQVNTLTQSIAISTNLFRSARADYMEVLLTQRDALEAKIELIESRKEQLLTRVEMYRALGGGWK